MKVIALDSSSAIYLAKIGLLPKLLEIGVELLTTSEVSEEIKKGAEKGYKDARIIEEFIKNKDIKETSVKKKEGTAKNANLKGADASIMALAVEKSCLLATEDSTLQNIAESVGVSITNTATLLYHIYKENHMAKQQCIMLLDLLGQYGYNKEIILEIKEEIIEEGESDE